MLSVILVNTRIHTFYTKGRYKKYGFSSENDIPNFCFLIPN